MARPGSTRRTSGPVSGRGGTGHERWRVPERAARRRPDGQGESPGSEATHRPARRRVLQEEPGEKRGERGGGQGDRAADGLGAPQEPVGRGGDAVPVHDRVRRWNGQADRDEPDRQHDGMGPEKEHRTAQPGPDLRGRGRRGRRGRPGTARDRNEPTTTLAANTPVSSPITPPESPSLCPITTMQNSSPSAVKFNRPYRKAVMRRKGWCQVNASPSAARRRAVPGSRWALLLETDAHEQQRDGRTGVGEGIGQEGKRTTGFEQGPAQRRPDDPHGRRPAALRARRLGQLLSTHDGSQGSRLGSVEDCAADALDKGHAREHPEGHVPHDKTDRKTADGGGSQRVGGDHQATTIPAVRRQTGGNGKHRDGDGAGKGDESRLDGGVGQRKSQERVRNGRRLRARTRKELPRLEQHEVAVLPEGNGRHAATLSRAVWLTRQDQRRVGQWLRGARPGAIPRPRGWRTRCPRERSSPSRDRGGRSDCAPSAWPTAGRRRPGAARRPPPHRVRSL